ncbi:MAG TPA: hypothetical protein VG722_02255, partial [Tepidisphaeraceae bacterium]|nr:hypothetical protein [Tepidisphaeraceae bacterium]
IDEIEFEVVGTHTYLDAGTFNITTTIQGAPVDAIDSTADVVAAGTNITGAITGNYSLAPTPVDVGAVYVFNGSGTAGELGAVTAQGHVTLAGFITSGNATGALTLTAQSGDSVTLAVTAPTEEPFGPFPSVLNFTITSGTGQFAGATGSGTIAVMLGGINSFKFVITSN